MTIDPETLAAYADGELEPEAAARVEAALAADPALAGQVEAHRALRETLRAHFAPLADAPVPERLKALLDPPRDVEEPGRIVDFAAARQAREQRRTGLARSHWMTGGALAASLALGLVLGTQVPRGDTGPAISRDGQLVASAALDAALTRQLASDRPERDVRILLSFRAADGRYCRGFEQPAAAGIACHDEAGWAIERLQSRQAGGAADGAYRQAGSAEREIMEVAQNMTLNGALDSDAERKARDGGWRR